MEGWWTAIGTSESMLQPENCISVRFGITSVMSAGIRFNEIQSLQFNWKREDRRVILSGSESNLWQSRRLRNTNACKSPIDSGNICKDEHLPRSKSSKFLRLPKHLGSSTSLMHLRSDNSISCVQFPIDSGRFTMDLHSFIDRRVNLESRPMEEGIDCRDLHLSRTSSSRLDKSPRVSGSDRRALLWWPEPPPKIKRLRLRRKIGLVKHNSSSMEKTTPSYHFKLPILEGSSLMDGESVRSNYTVERSKWDLLHKTEMKPTMTTYLPLLNIEA